MTNCKIGKITLKGGGELRVFDSPKKSVLTDAIHKFATKAREDGAIAFGGFYIRKNNTVVTTHGYEAGTTNIHTIGGAAQLLDDIAEYERNL